MAKPDEEECTTCKGMGYICEKCREAAGECTCEDDIEEVPCPDCGGR